MWKEWAGVKGWLSHLLKVSLDDICVEAARHSFHEDVADVPQDAHGRAQHDERKDKCAGGICIQDPRAAILQLQDHRIVHEDVAMHPQPLKDRSTGHMQSIMQSSISILLICTDLKA
jgi:hypothetical protein